MHAKRSLSNYSEQDVIYHTQELYVRLKSILIIYLLTTFFVLFIPMSFLEFDFTLKNYKPAIIKILEWLLYWATQDIQALNLSTEFSITVGSPMAVIVAYIELAMIIAFILDFPFFAWQIYLFLEPGLHHEEKKALKLIAIASVMLFAIGAGFGFYLMPIVTRSLVSIAGTLEYDRLVQFYDLNRMISFLFWNVVATGVLFTYPILILGFVFFGITSASDLRKRRRHFISALLGITAIVTPDPTPVSMIILSFPLTFLYEITINIAYKLEKTQFFKDFKSEQGFSAQRIKKLKLS